MQIKENFGLPALSLPQNVLSLVTPVNQLRVFRTCLVTIYVENINNNTEYIIYKQSLRNRHLSSFLCDASCSTAPSEMKWGCCLWGQTKSYLDLNWQRSQTWSLRGWENSLGKWVKSGKELGIDYLICIEQKHASISWNILLKTQDLFRL